ncbi:MAG: LptF/LptG family permease [Rickettsiales bacterium]|nr:LptF/LptG family permease [Rickettsiales bacterium]
MNKKIILNNKIKSDFVMPFICSLLIVLGIIWFAKIMSIIELFSSRGVELSKFLLLITLVLPDLVFYITPFAVIAGFYILFQNYFFSREIYILRNIPISPKQLLTPIKNTIILIILMQFINGFFIAPISFQTFSETRNSIKSNFLSSIFRSGDIQSHNSGFVSYVQDLNSDDSINKFFIYRTFDDREEFLISESAMINFDKSNIAVLLENGIILRVSNAKEVQILEFDKFDDNFSLMQSNNNKKLHYKELTAIDLMIKDINNSGAKAKILAGILFKIFWTIIPYFIFIFAREIYFHGEFRRNGLGKKHLLFGFVAIFSVSLSFVVKNIAVVNLLFAILIIGLFLIISSIINLVNFSEKI